MAHLLRGPSVIHPLHSGAFRDEARGPVPALIYLRPVPRGFANTLNRHHTEGDRALKGDARRNHETEPDGEATPDGP